MIDVQIAVRESVPSPEFLEGCARAVLGALGRGPGDEMVIRVVDEAEGAALNARYRTGAGATNVLAFEGSGGDNLGDVVICAPVVARQAREQGKTDAAHWAHLVVHGVLHLLGYTHEAEADAARMEGFEVNILNQLGFSDPYEGSPEHG